MLRDIDWKKAFRLDKNEGPLQTELTLLERQLAEKFCPKIFVNSALFDYERQFLRIFITKEKIAEALFLFGLGNFPQDTTAAELRLLAPILKNPPKPPSGGEKHFINEDLFERVEAEYSNVRKKTLEERVYQLFDTLIPEKSPTFVMKYRPCRFPISPQKRKRKPSRSSPPVIYCLQYFAYWPIQLFPQHEIDYEPVYVFVQYTSDKLFTRRTAFREDDWEPLMIAFNANPKGLRETLSFLRSGLTWTRRGPKFLKRPGHIIQTYFNWDKTLITEEDYNPMASYMTEIFGGQYSYKQVEGREESHIRNILDLDGRAKFHIPSRFLGKRQSWHAYEAVTGNAPSDAELVEVPLCDLQIPDLYHIEWSVRDPFHAPFLYPNLGEKNPLMHMPFNLATICDEISHREWLSYASREYALPHRINLEELSVSDYQQGILLELLRDLQYGKNRLSSLKIWEDIEEKIKIRKKCIPILEELDHLDRNQQRDPREYFAKIKQESVKTKLGNLQSTQKKLTKAIDDYPVNPYIHELLGYVYHQRGRNQLIAKRRDDLFKKSEAQFEQAINLASRTCTYFRRANLFTDIGVSTENGIDLIYYTKAIEDLNEILKRNPRDVIALLKRGQCYQTMTEGLDRTRNRKEIMKFDKLALKDFEQAVKFAPNNPYCLTVRGCHYLSFRQWKKFFADIERAIALEPEWPRPYRERARMTIYHERIRTEKQYERILRDLNRAIQLGPHDGQAYFWRAYALLVIEEIIGKDPGHPPPEWISSVGLSTYEKRRKRVVKDLQKSLNLEWEFTHKLNEKRFQPVAKNFLELMKKTPDLKLQYLRSAEEKLRRGLEYRRQSSP